MNSYSELHDSKTSNNLRNQFLYHVKLPCTGLMATFESSTYVDESQHNFGSNFYGTEFSADQRVEQCVKSAMGWFSDTFDRLVDHF